MQHISRLEQSDQHQTHWRARTQNYLPIYLSDDSFIYDNMLIKQPVWYKVQKLVDRSKKMFGRVISDPEIS